MQKLRLDPKELFYCNRCPCKSALEVNLSSHIRKKHSPRDNNKNPAPKLYKCSECEKGYSNRKYFLMHTKACNQESSVKNKLKLEHFYCDHCNYKTINKSRLAEHINLNHLARDASLNKCEKCGKMYLFRTSLRRHSKNCGQSKSRGSLSKFKLIEI